MITRHLFLGLLGSLSLGYGQYSTPNTGVKWTLDSIAVHSPTTLTVSGNTYTLHQNLMVEANDSLILDKPLTLQIDANVEVGVRGYFRAELEEEEEELISITSTNFDTPYKGFWLYDTSEIIFRKTKIEHGGGIRAITSNFLMENCVVSNNHNSSGSSTGGAITFSNGNPIVRNSVFENNIHPAIGSSANAEVYALIEGNYVANNNLTNNNRPQINMGPSGNNGVIRIINNEVIGNPEHTMVGGIAVSSLVGIPSQMEIRGNIVRNNRYGVTAIGPVGGEITDNILEDNIAETNPNNGGSGISLYGTPLVKIRGNEIRRNLWGITVISNALTDLGTEEDPGNNIFSENGNGGQIYALYNNTSNSISALKNCWIESQESTAEDVEGVIFHVVDDSSLGEVLFDPFNCGIELGVEDLNSSQFVMYPNPAKNLLHLESKQMGHVKIYDLNGRMLQSVEKYSDKLQIQVNLPKGVYLVEFSNENSKSTQKLIIQ